jgi:mono-ADP-ribosyltransferase sirtuin 6
MRERRNEESINQFIQVQIIMMPIQRHCDGEKCRYCGEDLAESDNACAVAVPSKRLSKFSKKSVDQFCISWDVSRNSNFFHLACWNRCIGEAGRVEKMLLHEVEDTIERFDTIGKIREDAQKLASLLRNSKQTICFTGAGLSAAAGIPTYRGAEGIDTIASSGGALNEPVNKRQRTEDSEEAVELEETIDPSEEYTRLQPSAAHSALVDLHRAGRLHFCITQNCDDLHGKSGFPRNSMSELHGNVFCEYCERCWKEYFRDYCVDLWSTDCHLEPWYEQCHSCRFNHYTSRICEEPRCGGKLRDTIVNFGDGLHKRVLGGLPKAIRKARHSDVCLCLGTSLTVTPACDIPVMAKSYFICNLQDTPLDSGAAVRSWSTCDLFFSVLASEAPDLFVAVENRR